MSAQQLINWLSAHLIANVWADWNGYRKLAHRARWVVVHDRVLNDEDVRMERTA